jgi:hypothetical protein
LDINPKDELDALAKIKGFISIVWKLKTDKNINFINSKQDTQLYSEIIAALAKNYGVNESFIDFGSITGSAIQK